MKNAANYTQFKLKEIVRLEKLFRFYNNIFLNNTIYQFGEVTKDCRKE
tara:strand:- start:461 stop:604 length:144 start_codon:yes stop_codon:yes gene_type:complete